MDMMERASREFVGVMHCCEPSCAAHLGRASGQHVGSYFLTKLWHLSANNAGRNLLAKSMAVLAAMAFIFGVKFHPINCLKAVLWGQVV